MRISRQVSDDNRKSHHAVGTKRFACIDGEGVKGYNSSNDVETTFCITCNNDITHRNRYWISLNGPYCRICYYTEKGVSPDTIIHDANSDKFGSFTNQKYGFSDEVHTTIRKTRHNDFIQ